MVTCPSHYNWSSHHDYCGNDHNNWIEKDLILGTYDSRRDIAMQIYLEQINDEIPNKILECIINPKYNGTIIGSDHFVEKITSTFDHDDYCHSITVDDIIQVVCSHFDVIHVDLIFLRRSKHNRLIKSVIAYMVSKTEHVTFRALSQRLNMSMSYCSNIAKECEKNLASNDCLAETIECLFEEVSYVAINLN